MPTDLERQLARFAEALDREGPTISIDEMVSRGTVAVDVDFLEHLSSNLDAWIDTAPGHDETDEGDELIELAPALVVRRPAWRRVSLKVALGAAAAAVLVVSLAAIEWGGDELNSADDLPSLTTTFVSPTNGFSIQHPDGAVVTPATDDDSFDVVDTGLAGVFKGTSKDIPLLDEAVIFEGGRISQTDEMIDDHLSDYDDFSGGCGVPRSQQAEITIDGHPGRIAECPNRIEATVVLHLEGAYDDLVTDGLYVFTLSHERSDARAVFDAFVATIDLTPETAVHFPAMTKTFVSPTNGFSFGYIDRGRLEPARGIWDPIDQQLDADRYDRFDYFDTGFGAGFAGASTEIPEGVSIDAWVDEHVTPRAADGCGEPRSTQAEISIDGQSGRTAECARRVGNGRVEATVVAGGRLYLFAMLHNRGNDARAWFDAWVTTIDLTPETAERPR